MKPALTTEILVAGNGPAGMAAALALSKAGFDVALAAPENTKPDHRTTTLMMPSIRFLDELDVWDAVKSEAEALSTMRIVDGTNRLIRARTVSFEAAEIGENAFGWNMPNMRLNASLLAQIKTHGTIRTIGIAVDVYEFNAGAVTANLADGTMIRAKLVVGADGRTSLARRAAGVEVRNWTYPQTAFITVFEHRLAHEGISTEFHTEQGPCVQVPLPGNRSSLVWVVRPEKAEELMAMEKAALSRAIEDRIASILGKVTVGATRQTYPLSGQYPLSFAKNRIALVGEAAHVFPPIGAQGLNLGLRDVEDLVKATISNPTDPGADTVLSAYDRARRPDITARTGAVDALNRALLSSLLPAQIARATGMAFLDMAAPLRSLFMREGMRPGDGFRALASDVREGIRRKVPLGNGVEKR